MHDEHENEEPETVGNRGEALRRLLDEADELRVALAERVDGANERFGRAQRLVEEARAKLAEIDTFHRQAADTLADANQRATVVLAEAEARARTMQENAEAEAVERLRRAERRAADRLAYAELEAMRQVDRVIDDATQARHAEIDSLHAREREVQERIDQLLNDADLAAMRRTALARTRPSATPSTGEPATIDLTVTQAVRDAIDEWVARREVS